MKEIMTKDIKGYGSFNTVVIKSILEDDTILCDVRGMKKIKQPIYSGFNIIGECDVEIPICDTNISFENGKFFTLTSEEIEEIKNHKKKQDATHN